MIKLKYNHALMSLVDLHWSIIWWNVGRLLSVSMSCLDAMYNMRILTIYKEIPQKKIKILYIIYIINISSTKYPHLVFGCVASSAPVNLVVTNTPWFVDVTQALSNTLVGGLSSCASQVQAGYARIDTLLRTKNYAQLVNDFQLCDPPKS